jgi:hypothetical protein
MSNNYSSSSEARMGFVTLPFDCVGASLKAESLLNGQIAVSYYGADS